MTETEHTIREILDDVKVCMLIDQFQGGLRARPMALHFDETDEALWFVTDTASGKIEEIARNPEVCVSVQDGQTYASVTGNAEIVDDIDKLKDIWSVFADAWYPGGPESSNVTLLRVTPHLGEYWKGDSKLVAGTKMLIASLRDERPDVGDHARVRFG